MINAEVSKGKVFAMPSYIYTKLGPDEVMQSTDYGDISIAPEMAMNIAGLMIGIHETVNKN